MRNNHLSNLLVHAALAWPQAPALTDTLGHSLTYAQYHREAEVLQRYIAEQFPQAKNIAIISRKSIASLLIMQGILQAGCCYVPYNPYKPLAQNLEQFRPSGFDVAFVCDTLLQQAPEVRASEFHGQIQVLGHVFHVLFPSLGSGKRIGNSDWAYILFTSGSTGKPKGVIITHQNALAFINWCSETFNPQRDEVAASIAPWCFDLSVLDIYLAQKHGNNLLVLTEEETQNPRLLAQHFARFKVAQVYATPTLLQMMVTYGNLHLYPNPHIKRVLFAGETFACKPLNKLREHWPKATYYNLYGPTETNVCTYFRLPNAIEAERAIPYPIGKSCEHLRTQIAGGEAYGELWVSGANVTPGYYDNPQATETAFEVDTNKVRWYKTGDYVQLDTDGNYVFAGRKDRQVKRKGFRIELDEIENQLSQIHGIAENAVIASTQKDQLLIVAYLVWLREGAKAEDYIRKTLIDRMESYKLPDRFVMVTDIPKTVSGKVDYQALKQLYEV